MLERINRREFLKTIGLSAAAATIPGCSSWMLNAKKTNQQRPNFVFIMTDDMGYADLGCFGHPVIKTPNIDKLAEQGVKLTACYASAAYCSPSRAGALTGRHPHRCGIDGPIMTHWFNTRTGKFVSSGPMPRHIKDDEITIAEILREQGYATCFVGKWHLQGRPSHPTPNDQGFDHAFWTVQDAEPSHLNPDNFIRNGKKVGRIEGLSAQIIVDEAANWLLSREDKSQPFCLFVWTHETHTPIATLEKYKKIYRPPATESQATYYGDVSHTDEAVGRLMETLEENDMAKNTFIFFSADNGCEHIPGNDVVAFRHGSTGPLRGCKGYTYEGGIRVPGIIRWPGRVKPGSVSDVPICNTDLLPTICEIIGAEPPTDRAIDGTSIVPVLKRKSLDRKRPLYWQQDNARNGLPIALRDGDYKLLADTPVFKRVELYNLKDDIGETTNLAELRPDLTEQMVKKARQLYEEIYGEYSKRMIEWYGQRKK